MDAITLAWSTSSEEQTAGFRILRSTTHDRGDAAAITKQMILAGVAGDAAGVRNYRFDDLAALPGVTYRYWLLEVDLMGETHEYSPVLARIPAPDEAVHIYLPLVIVR